MRATQGAKNLRPHRGMYLSASAAYAQSRKDALKPRGMRFAGSSEEARTHLPARLGVSHPLAFPSSLPSCDNLREPPRSTLFHPSQALLLSPYKRVRAQPRAQDPSNVVRPISPFLTRHQRGFRGLDRAWDAGGLPCSGSRTVGDSGGLSIAASRISRVRIRAYAGSKQQSDSPSCTPRGARGEL